MVMTLGEVDCIDPCGTCSDPCATCTDFSGARSVLLTTDIVTTTDLDPSGLLCPECESYAAPTELTALPTIADAEVALSNFASFGCNADADRVEGTACGYSRDDQCNTISTAFDLYRFAATYRTAGGDLRMFVGATMSYSDGIGCSGTTVGSADFLLASGASAFVCLGLDHNFALAICSGSTPACGCSFPVNCNVKIIAV